MRQVQTVVLSIGFFVCFCFIFSQSALAVQVDELLKDPVLEARARVISQQLRCPVCQNQSIDDSDAPLAKDLRLLVRKRLLAGDKNEQILAFVVARYGSFVLLKPPLERSTLLLWLLPLLCLGFGFFFVKGIFYRTPSKNHQAPSLTSQEEADLQQWLNDQKYP